MNGSSVSRFAASVTLTLVAGPLSAQQDHSHHNNAAAADTSGVPLYTNLGTYRYPVTVRNPQAQAYFDQGVRLTWGFNHAEAIRAFAEGERIDSSCAMCAWGIAFALGPNINAPMDSATEVQADQAIRRAAAAAGGVSPREQAMIQALQQRYANAPASGRAARDSAWARSIGQVARQYPNDDEIQVLAADALMNLSPWYYWEADGSPRPDTPQLIALLEAVIARSPENPGACHLYIHAVEAKDPDLAVPCAERLAALMPGAGHIVHMPGHIYVRVGRYADAIQANQHAVHADETFFEVRPDSRQGLYGQGYYAHNYHFLAFAAQMAGAGDTAIASARKAVAIIDPALAETVPTIEAVTPAEWWMKVTFGRWNDILTTPLPPARYRFAYGQAMYARGVAFAARGDWGDASAALDSVTAIARAFPEGENKKALQVARHALAGEIALRQGDAAGAVAEFSTAVDVEDSMVYIEPPTWYYPMRQSLGKALLAANRPAEAEIVYRQDLARFRENGWSLYGLVLALEAQGRQAEAAEVRARFQQAWRLADVEPTGSRM